MTELKIMYRDTICSIHWAWLQTNYMAMKQTLDNTPVLLIIVKKVLILYPHERGMLLTKYLTEHLLYSRQHEEFLKVTSRSYKV